MKNPDFGAIAGAYGIPFLQVTELNQVAAALKTAAEHKGAFMVEFLCDPSEIILPMVPAGGGIADMIVSRRS
jgi:acetolactate synthase-1/2/3 large subunit